MPAESGVGGAVTLRGVGWGAAFTVSGVEGSTRRVSSPAGRVAVALVLTCSSLLRHTTGGGSEGSISLLGPALTVASAGLLSGSS